VGTHWINGTPGPHWGEADHRLRHIGDALNASGLWASYGDVAEATGWGHGRSVANLNWEAGYRFADRHGYAEGGPEDREQRWTRVNVAEHAANLAFGYLPNVQAPTAWRAGIADLRRLGGYEPMNDRLAERLHRRLGLVSSIASDPSHPYAVPAGKAAVDLAALIGRLGA
jgi:hypothetical protein